MDLIVSPTTVAFNTQPGAPVPTFQAGEVVDALVLQLLENGSVRLSIGNSLLDVQTQVPLVPGTTVRLAVKNTTDGVRLVIVDNGLANPAAASTPGSNVAATAVRAAAAAQGAINSGAASGANISQASSAPPETPGTIAQSPPSPSPLSAALSQAVRVAAVRQNGLAPLFADLAQATAPANVGVLPPSVRDAAGQLMALRPSLDGNLTGDDIKQALVQSGLFLETRIAAAVNAGSTPSAHGGDDTAHAVPAPPNASAAQAEALMPAPGEDLKAALTVFRQVLATWLGADATAIPVATAGATRFGLPLPVSPQAPPLAPDTPATEQGVQPKPVLAPMPPAPPPPYRGAPTAPQPSEAPSIPIGADPHEIGARLLAETDGALSRQTLLQAASLPEAATLQAGQVARGDPSGPRWNFEVPFATPQGNTAIAQFEISRDGRSVPAKDIKPVWRARFTLDVEPMGAVHAQVALIGSRTAVTLWAERGGAAAKLRENSSLLSDALKQAELEPGDVLVRDGSPPRPQPAKPAGRFLDRAS